MITRETVLAAFEKRLADDPLVSAEWHAFARGSKDIRATVRQAQERFYDVGIGIDKCSIVEYFRQMHSRSHHLSVAMWYRRTEQDASA
jgi:hypothetical protein